MCVCGTEICTFSGFKHFYSAGAFASCATRGDTEGVPILNLVVLANEKGASVKVHPSTEGGRRKANMRGMSRRIIGFFLPLFQVLRIVSNYVNLVHGPLHVHGS